MGALSQPQQMALYSNFEQVRINACRLLCYCAVQQ